MSRTNVSEIFSSPHLDVELRARLHRAAAAAEQLPEDRLRAADAPELTRALFERHRVEAPRLRDEGVSRSPLTPGRMVVTFHVPIDGDASLFGFAPPGPRVLPPRLSWNCQVEEGDLHVTVPLECGDAEAILGRLRDTLGRVRGGLARIEAAVAAANAVILAEIRRQVEARAAFLRRIGELDATLGVPVRPATSRPAGMEALSAPPRLREPGASEG